MSPQMFTFLSAHLSMDEEIIAWYSYWYHQMDNEELEIFHEFIYAIFSV